MPYIGQPAGWGHALQRQGNRVESIGKLHYRDVRDPAGFDEEHIPMQVANGVGMVWASILAPPLDDSRLPTTPDTCETPVSLIDISETILDHFGTSLGGERPGKSLYKIAAAPVDWERIAFSEYHAV